MKWAPVGSELDLEGEATRMVWAQPFARAVDRVAAGITHASAWHRARERLTLDDALAIAAEPPPIDLAVVCHGDACAPNTIIDAGRWSGHVDLGSLGVADRWADLAIATWSTEWNYGPGWETALLDAYGIDPDPARTAYYRLLWVSHDGVGQHEVDAPAISPNLREVLTAPHA